MSDSSSLAARVRGLSWLVIETPARAAGFLSVIAIVTILALRFEFGHSWNLYAGGGQVVKAGGHIQTVLQRRHDAGNPILGDEAAVVGDAEDHGLDAKCLGRLRCHLGQIQIDRAAGEAVLSRAQLAAPLTDTGCRFGVGDIGGIAQEQKIGGLHA